MSAPQVKTKLYLCSKTVTYEGKHVKIISEDGTSTHTKIFIDGKVQENVQSFELRCFAPGMVILKLKVLDI